MLEWNPALKWLTGSHEQVERVSKMFRVYYSMPDTTGYEDEDYLVDHSIFFYLLDSSHQFIEFYGKHMTPDEVAAKIAQQIKFR